MVAVNGIFAKPDPLEQFAASVSARRPRKRASGSNFLVRVARCRSDKYIRETEARRAELERRNGAKARAAFDRIRGATQAQVRLREREFEPEISPLVAATMHISPSPLYRIY